MKVTPVNLLKRRTITMYNSRQCNQRYVSSAVSEQLKSKDDVTRFTSHLDKYFDFDIVCSLKTTR